MEFEDILDRVGDFGKYQKDLMLLFLYPASVLLPWFSMNILFLVSVPDHWCRVPELEAFNLTLEEQQRLIRPPSDPKCTMYDINYTEFLSSSDNWTVPDGTVTKSCPSGYVYDRTYYDSTAATKWDLVCGDSHYVSLVLTLANAGSAIGTPLYGFLSDRIGRKPTFFVTVFVTFTSAVASVLMTDFVAFIALRTINGSIMPSIFQLPYIILLEIVGPAKRATMNGITNTSWTVGLCMLPLLAYLSRTFVVLGLITSSVTAIFLVYWKLLPESPRWLLSRERYDESAAVLAKIAKKNGKKIDEATLISELKALGEKTKKENKQNDEEDTSVRVFFKYPKLRKHFFILTFLFCADIAAYYGLQINAQNLDGNEFVNFFLLAIVEFPGYIIAWWFMQRFGRRWCSVWTLNFTGLVCLIPAFVPNSGIAVSLAGKFGAGAAFMAMYQQCSELFPTPVRALGMGLSGTVAILTTIAVPYIVYLAEYGKYIPFTIIALINIAAGFASLFLPETLNENLPQTLSDAESFGLNQKFFSCNRKRRHSSCALKDDKIKGKTSQIELPKR